MAETDVHDEFASRVAGQRYQYQGAWYVSVGIQRDGTVDNLASRMVFDRHPPSEPWTFETRLGDLLISRGWLPRADADTALRELKIGRLPLGSTALRAITIDEGELKPYRWRLVDHLGPQRSDVGWKALQLEGSGSQPSRLLPFEKWEELSRRMPAAKPRPFGGWIGLSEYLGGLKLDYHTDAAVDVFAPTYRRIAGASMDKATGALDVVVELLDGTTDSSLSLLPKDQAVEPLTIPQSEWQHEGNGVFRIGASLPPDVGAIDMHLVTGESTDDSRVVGAPSLSGRAHRLFDTDGLWLRNLLGLEGNKVSSDGFEHGIGTLLALAGLPAVHYGFASRPHFPDFVICVGDRSLVAECTTDVPTRSKLEQVAGRAHKVRALVSEWYGSFLHARAMFTPLPWSQMPADVVEASCEELQVALVFQERLEVLYEMAVRRDPIGAFWAKLQNWGSAFGASLRT